MTADDLANTTRRRVLGSLGATGILTLAGCTQFESDESSGGSSNGDTTTATSYGNVPPVLEDRPAEPYFPTHVEGMSMVGKQMQGDYACALGFTFPHRFWLVTGTRTRRVVIRKADTVHLMPVVWHTKAKLVPPDISPQVSITKDGNPVADFAPWPMLSQPMGFHFGDNVGLNGDGTYTVTVDIGSPSGNRTGGLEPNDPLQFEFEWDFRQAEVDAISYRDISSDREGLPGAISPMDMMSVGMTQAPKPDALPGTTRLGITAGAEFYATIIDDASDYGGTSDQSYLAVSPRTKYNRFILPMMSLSTTVTNDGDSLHDGALSNALDPKLGYHYGTPLPAEAGTGTNIVLSIDAPPQTARHEGYETAFVEMDDLEANF